MNKKEPPLTAKRLSKFRSLSQEGDATLLERISLLVEQERALRQQKDKLEEELRILVHIKNDHYSKLEQKNSEL
ncbi:MAG TPA: transcriptional regulator [Lactococcus sp.]|uniref:transcriptional regulator n=1 Tax=Lactococcus TaxID=1357 RepID=UPI000E9E7216|nr:MULTISPECIES: transcriptional regulator [Lactococcus]HBC89960.1 transcriptional regulator [Lactococcus sp.]